MSRMSRMSRLGRVTPSRAIWLLLAVAAIALLAIGSIHPSSGSAASRVAYLDSVIKCPSCEDLSITQSDAPSAVTLRHRVATWVAEGWSNAEVEQEVVATYGENGLLIPPSGGVNTTLYVVPVAIIGIAAAGVGWHLLERRKLSRTEPPAS